MNRMHYYDYIEEKLHILALRVETGGKLNLLSLHNHSENFYLYFFNSLFGWQLENLNNKLQNVEAIDLIDTTNKILVQVSSTNTKHKVESALIKPILDSYKDYTFKFISISKNADNLRKMNFKNPYGLKFDPKEDIYDTYSILKIIFSLDAAKLKLIYQFVKLELGDEIDIAKFDYNLAMIINVLSKVNWDQIDEDSQTNSFEIERKMSFNNLESARYIIEDYKIHSGRLDQKYSEFDSLGVNKSSSVLWNIRKEYLQNMKKKKSDELFECVIDNIQDKIIQSANFILIPIDELELCINILVVDAFIRCKIFENPDKYQYVTS